MIAQKLCVLIWSPSPHIYRHQGAAFRASSQGVHDWIAFRESSQATTWKARINGLKVGSAEPGTDLRVKSWPLGAEAVDPLVRPNQGVRPNSQAVPPLAALAATPLHRPVQAI